MTNNSTDNEIWKEIQGYEGIYEVSNLGRVRSLNRTLSNGVKRKGKVLKHSDAGSGYSFVVLSNGGTQEQAYVHRLVAGAFVKKEPTKNEVDHLDNDKSNNNAKNLEWVSRSENVRRSWSDGLMENQRKVAIENGKARAKRVLKMDEKGNVLKEFRSQKEAASYIGVSSPSISMCCTGVIKSAGGFRWKFADDII